MTTIDENELHEFAGRFIADLGAASHAATVVLGDRLGLYKALASAGPATPAELAAAADCDERYIIEWLNAQAASGYCQYEPGTGRYWLSPVQAACLADDMGPAFLAAGMTLAAAMFKDEDLLASAYRSGSGVGWGEHHADMFAGVERFFRPGYQASLIGSWIPALDGVPGRLQAGIDVADVGCGHGASTLLLAQAFPASRFTGFDAHPPSVEAARKAASAAGLGDRVSFEVASAQDFPGSGYGLACIFDALHDMGDPVGAASHIRSALAEDGTWLLVEPMAGESLADNLNPLGRVFYSASALVCTPCARSQPGGWALGNQASEAQLQEICARGGFTRFRRAAETPVNRVFEVCP